MTLLHIVSIIYIKNELKNTENVIKTDFILFSFSVLILLCVLHVKTEFVLFYQSANELNFVGIDPIQLTSKESTRKTALGDKLWLIIYNKNHFRKVRRSRAWCAAGVWWS